MVPPRVGTRLLDYIQGQLQKIPAAKRHATMTLADIIGTSGATGITMMATAQGADHTAGNLPRLKTREMDAAAIVEQSLAHQARVAANDSLGLCIFGMSVTNPNTEFIAASINDAHGTNLGKEFFEALGRETLRLEDEFNRRAGFTAKDDELPEFFYTEPLPPTNLVARFHAADVHGMYDRLPA